MIERLLFIFGMCMAIKIISTISKLSEISGNRRITVGLLGIDTILFLLVFKNVIDDVLTIPVVLTMAIGYMVGYVIGWFIEEKMAIGQVMVTIKISKDQSKEAWKILKDNGFIFTRSKRAYSHKGKLRKIYQGVVFRRDIPKLKQILKGLNFIAYVEPLKTTFGKKLLSTEEYLENCNK